MLHRAPRVVMLATLFATSVLTGSMTQAGTTGKLVGKVTNEKKEPLAGVNVRIEAQRVGAVSDEKGEYFIIGVLGGEYVVRANILGYAPFIANKVTVTPDFTTELNIEMKPEAVQMEEVRVEAERPLLQKDATNTTRFISSDQISRMPTRGYQEAAAQSSGIVSFQRQIDREAQNGPTLIVRGGRPNETAYYLDGFSQQDPLTGNATTAISNNAIQEVVVQNGGFNAEYGRAMSGVINVITREGTDKYSGSLEALTDNFGGYGNDLLGAKIYDNNVYDGTLGGPIFPGKDWGNFYYSGQRRYQSDRSPRANYDEPLPSNALAGWTHQGKLSIPLGKPLSLKLSGLWADDDWQQYLNTYRFNLAHAPRYEDRNRSFGTFLNHTLNAKSFYSVGANFYQTERTRGDGVYFDNIYGYGEFPQADLRSDIRWFWPGLSGPQGDPLSDSLRASAERAGGTGHVFDDYLRRKSQYWAVRGDYTNQWNAFHQLRAGFEYDQHTLRFYNHFFPVNFWDASGDSINNDVDIDRYGYSADGQEETDEGIDGPRKPKVFSVYLQDKYERAGLVVNGGLRYDYINTDVGALADEDLPLGNDGTLDEPDLVENKTYSRVSPRLGIGFPVTDRMVLHANWGQFFQQPNLQDLYVSYRFLEHKVRTGGYFVGFGNPNLKPEQTTAYEVGISQQVNDYAKFDISAYYKDVKDLVQIEAVPSFPNQFSTYRNKDFATLKGVDMAFTLRRVNHIQANVAYSLSWAFGTGSVSNTQRNVAWTASDPPKQTAPLDFDQRHKISVNLDYGLGKAEGPKLGGINWLENFNFNVLYNIASGTPYTPTNIYDEVTLAAVASEPQGALNSRYGPWTNSLDFKVSRGFNTRGLNLAVYALVQNLFDTDNAINVFSGTGSPNTTAFLNTPEGRAVGQALQNEGIDPNAAYNMALQNENLYSIPRTIRFGMRVGF
ncbi:MAG TPA: TonB-dependent receptor [Candidatus Eisenbacteria bacterium]|nr:TonB-dependent receptor [Candidatus Eisenbacteria bacterium]